MKDRADEFIALTAEDVASVLAGQEKQVIKVIKAGKGYAVSTFYLRLSRSVLDHAPITAR